MEASRKGEGKQEGVRCVQKSYVGQVFSGSGLFSPYHAPPFSHMHLGSEKPIVITIILSFWAQRDHQWFTVESLPSEFCTNSLSVGPCCDDE